MKKNLCIVFLMLLISLGTMAQRRTVTGTVRDKVTNGPIPGAGVVENGTTNGAITGANGEFSLSVGPNAVLKISFLGMDPMEVAVGNKSKIEVQLTESTEILEDVVVTALGIKRELKSLGYASQQVKGEDIGNSGQTNVINAIGGKVAGIQVVSTSGSPGASANIVIRGRTSLSSNAPLFVVDGVPLDNNGASNFEMDQSTRAIDINPNDIESMTVLKGPAACTLYGLRASGGAIIISTKKGHKTGNKIRADFSSVLSFDQVNKLPERQMLYAQGSTNSTTYVPTYAGPSFTNSNTNSWGPLLSDLRYDGSANNPYDKNGYIVVKSLAPNGAPAVAYDNAGKFFQTGVSTDNYLSLSGGNDLATFYFSTGYLKQDGIIPNSSFKRTNIKIGGEAELAKGLRISGSLTYTNSGGNRPQRGSNASGVMFGITRSPNSFDMTNGVEDPVNDPTAYSFTNGLQRSWYNGGDNPFWSVNKNLSNNDVNRYFGYAQISYQIRPWLSAMYRAGLDYYSEHVKSTWDNASAEYYGGEIQLSDQLFKNINSDFILTAQKEISPDFDLTAMVGHNYVSQKSYSTYMEGFMFVLPDFYNIGNVTSKTAASDQTSKYKIVGLYYDAKIAFRKYLYLGITGRNDWSSTLPKNSNSFFYPAYTLGFEFTKLLGMEKSKIMNYGKLRLSYAEVGHDASRYSLESYYWPTSAPVRGQTSYYQSSTIGNKNLKPEKTKAYEFGFDLRFFDNRLGLDLSGYQQRSVDQIIDVPVAFSSGFSYQTMNAGDIENKGLELVITGTPVKMKSFSWDIQVNFAKNKNTVVSLAPGVSTFPFYNAGVSSTSSQAVAGEPFGAIYGSRWLRNDQGQLIISSSGLPQKNQVNGMVGDPNPDWLMGIRNSFRYKDFYLTALIDIRQGGDVWNGTRAVMTSLGTHASTINRYDKVVFEGVNSSGQPNTVETNWYNYYNGFGRTHTSEAFIEDGSWIRLKEVNLDYSIPKSALKKLFVSNASIGISARNLFLITDYSGIDPETNLSGASNSLGRDYFNSPNTKGFAFRLKLGF